MRRNLEPSAYGTPSEDDFQGLFDDLDVNSPKLGPTVAKRNEKLRPEETRAFIEDAFRDGSVPTTGTKITSILPRRSRFAAAGATHTTTKRAVLEKLTAFFDRYFGLV